MQTDTVDMTLFKVPENFNTSIQLEMWREVAESF